jgi:hypothetical protein
LLFIVDELKKKAHAYKQSTSKTDFHSALKSNHDIRVYIHPNGLSFNQSIFRGPGVDKSEMPTIEVY